MSSAAALKKKPAESSEKAGKAARPEANPVAAAGMPAYLGGIAGGGGAPAFLQRAPLDGKPEIEEEEPLPDATIQRLPQDPFPAEGEEEELQDKAGAPVQAKLEINTPGDSFEQEADRVADAVTSGGPSVPVSQGTSAPSVQRKCASCGGESEDGGSCPSCAAKVQRKENGSSAPTPTSNVAQAVASPGAGSPIPDSTRAPIEAELGQDLGHVRVHEDGEAAEAASSIGAKAFTHGSHIWLGPGQSSSDTALMAHEATHTVQQGNGGSTGPALVQRAPADHQHPEDASAPQGRIEGELESEREEQGELDEDEEPPEVDPAEKRAKAAPLESQAKPDADRPAQEAPRVEQAAGEVEAEVDSPTEPMVEGQSDAPDASASEGEAPPEAADPVGEAVAQAAALPEPEIPEPVPQPPVARPVDGDGNPVMPDGETEIMVQAVAAQLQVSREAAYALRRKARQQRANAILLRGNLGMADQHIAEAESGLETAHGHMEVRHEALTEADNAHATSEAKAETVAQEAPGVQAQAEEAQDESGPMASEASDTSAQASANQSDDPDAAAEQQENSGQMASVASDSASMDQASTASQQRAVQLQADAAQAKEQNSEARASIDDAKSSAEQTDAKLVEMDGQASQARGELEPLTGTPDASEAEAQRLDDAAAAADQRVDGFSARLLQVQDQYVSDMRRVPGSDTLAEQNQGQIQRTEDPAAPALPAGGGEAAPAMAPRGYEGRRRVTPPTIPSLGNLVGLGPPPLTEEQRAEQEAAAQRADAARRARVEAIQNGAYGNFNEMDGIDKAGVALDLMLEDAFSSASNIKWPDFSAASAGRALLNIIDPTGPLNGIVGGLSRVASGALNLFDMDQWARDPLGNLLKSAADIATGITIVLGSIVALLGVAVAIMAAAIVLSWFTLAPALTPIIAWCTSSAATVGGWTISVGMLALYYQGLLIIKNIVDVMTAETAEELVQNTEQLQSDFSQVGEIGMQMGTAYLAAKGGSGMATEAGAAGRQVVTRAAVLEEVGEGILGAEIEFFAGEDISGVIGVARMAHGIGSSMRGGGGGDGGTPHGDDGAAPRPADADADAPSRPAESGAEPRPDAAALEAPPARESSSPPPDAPTPDAPTPNVEAPGAETRPPAPVEGPPPEPSRPMDTAPPEPPQPRADATGDGNPSARSDTGEPVAAPTPTPAGDGPAHTPTADVDGARTMGGDEGPAPRAEAQGGAIPRSGEEGGPAARPDADGGVTPRPDGDGPATPRPEGEADGTRPHEDSDANAPRPDDGDPAALRESAGDKSLGELSDGELRAETEQANSAPRQEVTDPALRDAGFDDVAHLDNDMDYIRSEEMGAACRVSNDGCGGTESDGTVTEDSMREQSGEAEDRLREAREEGADVGNSDGRAAREGEGESGLDASPTVKPADEPSESFVAEGDAPPVRTEAEQRTHDIANDIAARIEAGESQDALVAHLEELGYTISRDADGNITQVSRRGAKAEGLPLVSVDGDGNIVRVTADEEGRRTSRREEFMGGTPDKYSKTGREVLERMRAAGMIVGDGPLLRGNPNNLQLRVPILDADGNPTGQHRLVPIDENIDMGHIEAAVAFWNREGRRHGARSKVVRDFMLMSSNYEFQHKSINRSEGARMVERYLDDISGSYTAE